MPGPVPFAEIIRSGFVEGHHYGSVVALAADGRVAWSVGDRVSPVLPRSSNKPLQALAMVRMGLDLPPELLAVACASHSGEAFHLDAVRRILAGAGLDEAALRNIPDYPFDEVEKEAVVRAGGEPTRLAMNCSGKHAAMLATCVVNGWSTADYLDPGHPLQQGILEDFTELTSEPAQVAIDGCGAPLLSASVTGLARAFARLATAADGPERAIAEAIRTFPAYVSGTRRDERRLLEAVPGAIGKLGAEGVYAVGLPDGRAWAVKTDDGSDRARAVVMTAALVHDGVDRLPGVDAAALRELGTRAVLGGGEPVGEVRPLLGALLATS